MSSQAARADVLPPIIPREVLFGNPERQNPRLSPDGTRIAWVAPDDRSVLQVYIQTIGEPDVRPLTRDEKRGIREFLFCADNRTLVYPRDADGDENWHLYAVDLVTFAVKNLTPYEGAQVHPLQVDGRHPDELLFLMNHRDPQKHDVYRLRLSSGDLELDTENPGNSIGFTVDAQMQVRGQTLILPDGGYELQVRASADSLWQTLAVAGPDDTLSLVGFSTEGQSVYYISSLGSDTSRLIERHLLTGEETILAFSEEVDVGSVMLDPLHDRVQAVSFAPGRTLWKVVDPRVQADFEGIRALHEGDFEVVDRDGSDQTWLVAFTCDNGPVAYYEWDRRTRSGKFLFVHQPRLEGLELARMEPICYTTRDGLSIHGYLTLPAGLDPVGLPLVLLVHGGPWWRDFWGYNALAQWLANRGYVCLQPNFRGSTGYGKRFLSASYKQWGRAMFDDLVDAVRWAVARGIADPARVAIYGGSYGGYAALCGATFGTDTFCCAVDIVGPSSLRTFIDSIPPYWRSFRGQLNVRVGNPDDPGDLELLEAASPLRFVDRIVKPLLIAQGANDPRVRATESEQIVAAIERQGGSVTYVLYPDEGHGFLRQANRLDFQARAEVFLATWLGGRAEPGLPGAARVPGSTALVKDVRSGEVLLDTLE